MTLGSGRDLSNYNRGLDVAGTIGILFSGSATRRPWHDLSDWALANRARKIRASPPVPAVTKLRLPLAVVRPGVVCVTTRTNRDALVASHECVSR